MGILKDNIATDSDTVMHVEALEEYTQTEFMESIYIN